MSSHGYHVYLSQDVLRGFDHYKYSAIDTSPVSKYITHPFWNWIVKYVPLWIAPNVLTLAGFLLQVLNFSLLTYYDCDFYAASRAHALSSPVPNWVWIFCAFNNFASHTLDGIDGKHARRTKSSSPLGELFDHGLDSWATLFFPISVYSIFGRGENGVDVFRVYLIIVGVMFCFLLSHWEKYNTGILFLPWGYDISQLGMSLIYLITFIGGYELWKFNIPFMGITSSEAFEIVCYVGLIGMTIPPTIWNIYVSYREGTGKMRSFYEATRPLISTVLLFGLLITWIIISPYDIMNKQPRLFYWMTGIAFSNITCWLIIAQMSNTRCELFNWLLLPLSAIVMFVYFIPLGTLELYMLWSYCVLAMCIHLHFGISVVQEMCFHFKIKAFSVPPVKID